MTTRLAYYLGASAALAVFSGATALADIYLPLPDPGDGGLIFDPETQVTTVAGQDLPAPLLLRFDDQFYPVDAHVGDAGGRAPLSADLADFAEGETYLWVDQCDILSEIALGDVTADQGMCAAFGARGVSPMFLDLRDLEIDVFPEDLSVFYDDLPDEPEGQGLAELGAKLGDTPIVLDTLPLSDDFPGLSILSAAHDSGPSRIRTVTRDDLASGVDLQLSNGLNLVGFSANGSARILDQAFNCDPNYEGDGQVSWADTIDQAGPDTAFFALVVQDSGFCGDSLATMAPLLQDLPLPQLQNLAFRKPYVGIFDAGETYGEFTNDAFSRTQILISGENTAQVEEKSIPAAEPLVEEAFALKPSIDESSSGSSDGQGSGSGARSSGAGSGAGAGQAGSGKAATGARDNTRADRETDRREDPFLRDDLPTPDLENSTCGFADTRVGVAQTTPIAADRIYSEGALIQALFPGGGFWNFELAGVWFGAPQGSLNAQVDDEDVPLSIVLEGVTFDGRPFEISAPATSGDTPQTHTIEGSFKVKFDVPKRYIRAGQLSMPFTTTSEDWTCPAAMDEEMVDTRVLAFFLYSMEVEERPEDENEEEFKAPQSGSGMALQISLEIDADGLQCKSSRGTEFSPEVCEALIEEVEAVFSEYRSSGNEAPADTSTSEGDES